MSVKENIGAKFEIDKAGALFLTRRSRRLRRTSGRNLNRQLFL
jgi:hypothetical protein